MSGMNKFLLLGVLLAVLALAQSDGRFGAGSTAGSGRKPGHSSGGKRDAEANGDHCNADNEKDCELAGCEWEPFEEEEDDEGEDGDGGFCWSGEEKRSGGTVNAEEARIERKCAGFDRRLRRKNRLQKCTPEKTEYCRLDRGVCKMIPGIAGGK